MSAPETIADVSAEMRRCLPNTCADWASRIDRLNGTAPSVESLRDWFAGQALGSVIRTCAGDTEARKVGPEAYFAIKAYALADAMLAQRAKDGEA